MLNEDAVKNIRKYGVYQDTGETRNKVLFEDIGFNADKNADYVCIAGCVQPVGMPHVFSALKKLLDGSGMGID